MTCSFGITNRRKPSGFALPECRRARKVGGIEAQGLDERCRKIVEFKRAACKDGEFFTINQKGVSIPWSPICLPLKVPCPRRAKAPQNMERLTLARGGQVILSLKTDPNTWDTRGTVKQVSYGEEKYTFVEDCPNAEAGTLLLQGPEQVDDKSNHDAALRRILRAVKNAVKTRP
jgi:T-complex protein 1 subunit zeta